MDIGHIWTHALRLMWKFKFLWLFGLVLGLTSGGSTGNNGGTNFRGNLPFQGGTTSPFSGVAPTVIGIAVVVGLIFLLAWLVLFFYFRFVARGALVAAVQEIEGQGTATLAGAWKQGRTYYTRLLGLGFLVNVPLAIFAILLILVGLTPFIGVIAAAVNHDTSFNSIMAAFGITGFLTICCAVTCLIVITFVVHPLYEFAVRAIVLEDAHVREGIRRGITRVREHLGSVLTVYLILIGSRIGWSILLAIIFIPLAIVFGVVFVGLLRTDVNASIVAVLIAALPLWLLFGAVEGIFQTFEANVWTLTYLALMDKPQPAAA